MVAMPSLRREIHRGLGVVSLLGDLSLVMMKLYVRLRGGASAVLHELGNTVTAGKRDA